MTCARIVIIAVAHGVAICCLAAATGAISGGHLNPAVTLAFVVAGKETLIRAGLYVGAQVRNETSFFPSPCLALKTQNVNKESLKAHPYFSFGAFLGPPRNDYSIIQRGTFYPFKLVN